MSVQIDVDFRPMLGIVRDQGVRPTCLAHAVSTAHEHSRESAIPLSPEYLHFFATGGLPACGATMQATAQALRKEGQPTESDCPYAEADPPSGWEPVRGLQVFRRESEASSATAAEIHSAIRASRVAVIGITLPEPFFTPTKPWIIPGQGAIHGLHAVAAIGLGRYNGGLLVLIRNSWGSDWGDQGHAWLDERFMALHLREVIIVTHEVLT